MWFWVGDRGTESTLEFDKADHFFHLTSKKANPYDKNPFCKAMLINDNKNQKIINY